jgi:hypothetical protein
MITWLYFKIYQTSRSNAQPTLDLTRQRKNDACMRD